MAVQFLRGVRHDKSDRLSPTVSRHIPYAFQADNRTVVTHDGSLLQAIALRGLLFETADTTELEHRARLRDAMPQAVGSSRFAVYQHLVRREIDAALNGKFPDPFSSQIDERWRNRMRSRRMFANELYLSVVRRAPPRQTGWLWTLRRRGVSELDGGLSTSLSADIAALTSACDAIVAQLGAYEPKVLGAYEANGALGSEVLEFLSTLINADDRGILLPRQNLASYLPSRRISFGEQTAELAARGQDGRRLVAMVSIKEYPSATAAGMLDELMRLPLELTVSQSFVFVDRSAALSRMNLSLRRMRAADDEALSLRDELGLAKDDVAAGRAAYGEHHMTVAVHGKSFEEIDAGVAEVQASLADLGIIAVREDVNLEPAYWAQLPGNGKYIARRALISSENYAGLASLHNFPVGRADNNHWGQAVTLFETTAAGPYFFNFHQGDLGNFTVIGPSGSGKTVVINFLLAQARRYDPRIVFFDKDRGAELFIRAIGGSYDVLRPGVASGLNPLQLEDSPINRQFLTDWVVQLAGGADLEEVAVIRDALEANAEQPLEYRRLRYLVELFRGGQRPHAADLYARMAPWWGDGARAWLFDNEVDTTDLTERVVGFDMTQILDDPVARTPAMMVLFHRVEERLDGSPAIIVVDEGWKALDDDVFVARIKDWEKTIRKRNGIVGFATQSAQDALESRIASAIVEQAATQIFMPNPKARAEDYIGGFGLSEHEFELVQRLPESAHSFLVKNGQESVVARLNLRGERDILTILSGREETVRRLDRLRAEVGNDPERWLGPLLETV